MNKALLILIIAMVGSSQVHANTDKNLQNALAKAQFMLRQLQSEKLTIQKERDALKLELAELQKQNARNIAKGDKKEKKYQNQLSSYRDQYGELKDRFIELRALYRSSLIENKKVNAVLMQKTDNFKLCFDNNQKLFEVNQEILGKYENKGFWDIMKKREPVLGFKQVELENLVQEYQYKNEDLLLSDTNLVRE